MGAIRNPFRRKVKDAKSITFGSLADAECNLSSVDILRVLETGDEYRIRLMLRDLGNCSRLHALEVGDLVKIVPAEGSARTRYVVTEAGKRYIKSAEGI